MKIEVADYFFLKFSNIEFHQNWLIYSQAVSWIWTDISILRGAAQGCDHA
jgi:hypothetical protein